MIMEANIRRLDPEGGERRERCLVPREPAGRVGCRFFKEGTVRFFLTAPTCRITTYADFQGRGLRSESAGLWVSYTRRSTVWAVRER